MDRSILLLILLCILGLGLFYLKYKIQSAASKAIMTKVLFRSEHKEGQGLVNDVLEIESTASIPVIMDKLKTRIQVSDSLHIAFKGVLYQSSISSNRITYAYGHKATPKIFEAEVVLKDTGSSTKCLFRALSWVENSGIVTGREEMKKLRKQVLAAFKSADASGKKNEDYLNGAEEQQQVQKRTSVFCSKCGQKLDIDHKFCLACGTPSHVLSI